MSDKRQDVAARRVRKGVTLIELIVVLAVLGVLASVTVLAIRRLPVPDANRVAAAEISALRTRAITTRAAQHAVVSLAGKAYLVAALPDGSVIADSELAVNRFTGRSRDPRP